jgi:hypothetical protein
VTLHMVLQAPCQYGQNRLRVHRRNMETITLAEVRGFARNQPQVTTTAGFAYYPGCRKKYSSRC